MNKHIGGAKLFTAILVVAIFVIGAVMLNAVGTSPSLQLGQSNNQEAAIQTSSDLNNASQSLDASDQDLSSMDSSLDQLGTDANSF